MIAKSRPEMTNDAFGFTGPMYDIWGWGKIPIGCEGGFGMPLQGALAYDYVADRQQILHKDNAVSHEADVVQDTVNCYQVEAKMSDGRNCTLTWRATAYKMQCGWVPKGCD